MTHLRDKYEQADTITWAQVHNLLPIAITIIGMISVFYLLQEKVAVLQTKVTYNEVDIQGLKQYCEAVNDKLKALPFKPEVEGVATGPARLKKG